MTIEYRQEDLFSAQTDKRRIIPHICNDSCGWGSGFVVSISKHWKEPEMAYRAWGKQGYYEAAGDRKVPFELGNVQSVRIPNIQTIVCNMIAQTGTISPSNLKPIRYAALIRCMERIEVACRKVADKVEIHAPKFGAGLAGGNWSTIEELILEIWCHNGLKVIVYEYVPKGNI